MHGAYRIRYLLWGVKKYSNYQWWLNCGSVKSVGPLRWSKASILQAKHYSINEPPNFPGTSFKPDWTSKLDFILPETHGGIPIYGVLGEGGELIDGASEPSLPKEVCVHIYQSMVSVSVMDTILNDAQSQGRITFYLTNHGEEAAQVGSVAALNPQDLIWGQYRETGVLLHRGFRISQFVDQCFSNNKDLNKGRQMPVHYGSKDLHFVTISSSLATQMPQAVGAAYSYKLKKNGLSVVCYFGEGTTSEGDAHAAFNFAATLECPIIFICRNNGYAISTPTHEQYRGDGVASKGVGYGIATIRVNGNDVFAMYNAVKAAREMSMSQSRPVLVEAMTYRLGHHSTSDDSLRYRPAEEVNYWKKKANPIEKLEAYLIRRQWWSEEETAALRTSIREEVLKAIREASDEKYGPISDAFEDIYDVMPTRIQKQLEATQKHVEKYKEQYNLEKFESF